MARIRSIHPGMRKDEDFMPMSFEAKDALGALWMQCDDWGAFPWKPTTLKADIYPGNNVDMVSILAELVTHNWVMRIEIAGKSYGLCRNFCKWQRPKKPHFLYFIPDEFRTYVAYTPDEKHKLPNQPDQQAAAVGNAPIYKSAPVPHQFPTSGGNPPQREDGGDSRKNPLVSPPSPVLPSEPPQLTLVPDGPKPTKTPEPPGFAEFYLAFPLKKKRPAAAKSYGGALKRGATPLELLAGAQAYARQRQGEDPKFTAYPASWLNNEQWKDTQLENTNERAGFACKL